MSRAPEITDQESSVRPCGIGLTIETAYGGYVHGTVETPHGYVHVYSQKDSPAHTFTRLDIIFDGICYGRKISAFYTRRYLVTLAVRFAAEKYREAYQNG